MIILLSGVTYFNNIKTRRATHLKWIAQVQNNLTKLGYSFQVPSMLSFKIFEISYTAFALRNLYKHRYPREKAA